MPPESPSALPVVDNKTARRLFLWHHGLSCNPTPKQTKQQLLETIQKLGFVQIDSINTVERAHHMILFARNQTYQKHHLAALQEKDRALFENWTHDAAIIPMEFYPYWQTRFLRTADRLRARWRNWHQSEFEAELESILTHVQTEGACMSRDMGGDEKKPSGGWWEWHPSKTALEYLWRTGALSVDRRVGFQKVYDLTERVVPEDHRSARHDVDALVDWACKGALDRLGFAQSGELAAFWDSASSTEAKAWCGTQHADDLIEVLVESAGEAPPRKMFARPNIMERAANVPEPPARMRVLSPFDPMIRDRKRTERLFGYHYRIEVFVPEAKRQYGYYVFPLLEGDRLVGRIDMKCQRDTGTLNVAALWLEPKVKLTKGRMQKLEAELERLGRFSDCRTIRFQDGWVRT